MPILSDREKDTLKLDLDDQITTDLELKLDLDYQQDWDNKQERQLINQLVGNSA